MGTSQRLRQHASVVGEVVVKEVGHLVHGVAENLFQPEGDELLCNAHDSNSAERRKMVIWSAR